MRPADLARAALLPVTEPAVLLALMLFTVLGTIGIYGGLLGLFLLALLVPTVFRFQMLVLEATAKGTRPEPLDADNLSIAGSAWALFPLPLVIAVGWAAFSAWQRFGDGAAMIVLLIAGCVLPASLAVLAITRSPLQSINPVALGRLLKIAGSSFWIASVFLFVTSWLCLQLDALPLPVEVFVQLALMFSFFSVTGALIEPYGLMADVYIPDAVEPGEEEIRGNIEKHRVAALGHAYAFISRDNRKGGFDHIFEAIAGDADPAGAWAWYFDRMLGWENPQHALFFAQHYVHDALRHGEHVAALKAIMRCRRVDERFKPFEDDLPAAIAAAEASANTELAAVLKRG
jgi:hypothetical protein